MEESTNAEAWRNKWTDEHMAYIQQVSIEEGLATMFKDARAAGIRKLEFPVTLGKIIDKATDLCRPWATWQSWGPYHLFVNINS